MSNKWDEIKEHLEPVVDRYYISLEQDIQLSIAISLKRIADSLQKPRVEVQEYCDPRNPMVKPGGFFE